MEPPCPGFAVEYGKANGIKNEEKFSFLAQTKKLIFGKKKKKKPPAPFKTSHRNSTCSDWRFQYDACSQTTPAAIPAQKTDAFLALAPATGFYERT